LRGLLGWGIPAPGGKGGPRGLPSSFLANVLLAAQTDVDAILGQSLADDGDGSGRLRLTRALATLAQDPVFKRALDAAQAEVDRCFTPTGKRKRGQSSRFTEASQRVKQLEQELAELTHRREDSLATERAVAELGERRAAALLALEEAKAARRALGARLERAEARAAAGARLEEARADLA